MTPAHLRLISFLEGISFIVLIFIAMPLKYKFDQPFLVPYAGMAHGVLFIIFIVVLLVVCQVRGWSLKVFLIGLIALILPFAPFWFERYVHRLALAEDESDDEA